MDNGTIKNIIAQAIGIFAMVFNIWSYQQKQQKNIIALQLVGSLLFSIHFFIIGAYIGGLLNESVLLEQLSFYTKNS